MKLVHATKKLKLSHNRIMRLMELHTDDEIFTSNLYSYFTANTLDHYNWAIKKCKKISETIEGKTTHEKS